MRRAVMQKLKEKTYEVQRTDNREVLHRGPNISVPKEATRGQVATALKPFFPHLNHEERRRMVKNSKKRGRGYTKPLMNSQEKKRKRGS